MPLIRFLSHLNGIGIGNAVIIVCFIMIPVTIEMHLVNVFFGMIIARMRFTEFR